MTLDQTIALNDALRTELKGGIIAITPGIAEFPDWMLGRLIYRLTLTQRSMNDDHSEGVFVWAGWCVYWTIQQIDGERVLTLSRGDE